MRDWEKRDLEKCCIPLKFLRRNNLAVLQMKKKSVEFIEEQMNAFYTINKVSKNAKEGSSPALDLQVPNDIFTKINITTFCLSLNN